MLKSKSKGPLALSLLIACLVIGTMVMIANYFFRPGLELDISKRVVEKLYFSNLSNPMIKVEGRDVILKGVVANEKEAEKIEADIQSLSGIHQVENQLIIDSQDD